MRRYILIFAMLAPFAANAEWYLRYDPPVTKTATKAADISANAVKIHLANIDDYDAGGDGTHFYTREQSVAMLGALSSMCYQYPDPATRIRVETKPGKPAVCVWDRLKPAVKERVRSFGGAPE